MKKAAMKILATKIGLFALLLALVSSNIAKSQGDSLPSKLILSFGEDGIYYVQWRPDGKLLAVMTSAGIMLYNDSFQYMDTTQCPCLQPYEVGFGAELAWYPDNIHLLSTNSTGRIFYRLNTIDKTAETFALANPVERITDFVVSADGRYIAAVVSLSEPHQSLIYILDAIDGETIAQINLHFTDHYFGYLGWSPDSQWLAAIDSRNVVNLWNTTTWQHETMGEQQEIRGIIDLVWSPTGKYIASSLDGRITIWDVHQRIAVQSFLVSHDIVDSMAWSFDEKWLAAVSKDWVYTNVSDIDVWDISTGNLYTALQEHHGQWLQVLWQPETNFLTTLDAVSTLELWDLESHQVVSTLYHSDYIEQLAWSLDETRIAARVAGNRMMVWNVATGERLFVTTEPPINQRITVLGQDVRLAQVGDESILEVWDLDGDMERTCAYKEMCFVTKRVNPSMLESAEANLQQIPYSGLEGLLWNFNYELFAVSGEYGGFRVFEGAEWIFSVGGSVLVWHPTRNSFATDSSGYNLSPKESSQIFIWDAQMERIDRILIGHQTSINTLSWNSDGTQLASGDSDGKIIIWGQ